MEPILVRGKSAEEGKSFLRGLTKPLTSPWTYVAIGAGAGLVALSGGTGLLALGAEALIEGAIVIGGGLAIKNGADLISDAHNRYKDGVPDDLRAERMGESTFIVLSSLSSLKLPKIIRHSREPIRLELGEVQSSHPLINQSTDIFVIGSRGLNPGKRPGSNSDYDVLIKVPDDVILSTLKPPNGSESRWLLSDLANGEINGTRFLDTQLGRSNIKQIKGIIRSSLERKFKQVITDDKVDVFVYVSPELHPSLFGFGLQTKQYKEYFDVLTILQRKSPYQDMLYRQTKLR